MVPTSSSVLFPFLAPTTRRAPWSRATTVLFGLYSRPFPTVRVSNRDDDGLDESFKVRKSFQGPSTLVNLPKTKVICPLSNSVPRILSRFPGSSVRSHFSRLSNEPSNFFLDLQASVSTQRHRNPNCQLELHWNTIFLPEHTQFLRT